MLLNRGAEKTLESPLDSKVKPVSPEGNPPWILTGRTDGEAEALILWSPDVNSQLIRKDPDTGKDWMKAGGEGRDDRWWDAWMASQTQGTCVWANPEGWWRTGKPGMLRSMGSRELDTTEWLNDNKWRLQRGVLREKWDDTGLASSWPCQSWAVWKQAHNLAFC